jgi:hypothetical protein
MDLTYTYDPTQIKAKGKDQLRFEFGDTNVGGGAETCALSDEEYKALLEGLRTDSKKAWLFVKLTILEGIMFKLSYMVDTKIDVLSYALGQRADLWKRLYDDLRAQYVALMNVPTMADSAARKPPYFHTGMDDNRRANFMSYFPYRQIIT